MRLRDLTVWSLLALCAPSLFLADTARAEAPDATAVAQAVQVAEGWLALADRLDGKATHAAAAPLFQQAMSQADWSKTLTAARGPLGDVVSREMKSATHRTELPGAPDGHYVVVQFETSFTNKASATETVTPMLVDGSWEVSGYFVR